MGNVASYMGTGPGIYPSRYRRLHPGPYAIQVQPQFVVMRVNGGRTKEKTVNVRTDSLFVMPDFEVLYIFTPPPLFGSYIACYCLVWRLIAMKDEMVVDAGWDRVSDFRGAHCS